MREYFDSKGKAIRPGDVLQHIEDGERGVVTKIYKEGDKTHLVGLIGVGDMVIATDRATQRITNQHHLWEHISHNDQTYRERYLAWLEVPLERSLFPDRSEDEAMAIDGIMALLPDDVVDWDEGPWPDTLRDALKFMIGHLETLAPKANDK